MIQRYDVAPWNDGKDAVSKAGDGRYVLYADAEKWVNREIAKKDKEIATLTDKLQEVRQNYGIAFNEWHRCIDEITALKEEGQEAACINNHNVEVASQEIAKLQADNENMARLNDTFPEEIVRFEDEITEKDKMITGMRENKLYLENDLALRMEQIAELKEKIKEQDEEVYCPTCGACGEEGCCPPDRCEHLKCFYGPHYAKTYRELEAENERLLIFVKSVATEGQHDLGNNKLCDCALCRIIRSATKTKEGI